MEIGAEAAGVADQVGAKGGEAANIREFEKIVGGPIGLEEGGVVVACGGDAVFVGVEDVYGWVGSDLLGEAEQRVGGEAVAFIEEAEVLAGGGI